MSSDEDRQRERARALLAELRAGATGEPVREAKAMVRVLRDLRAFAPMNRLAEALCRIDPSDASTRRLYAQGLIETGAATAAIDMLRQLLATLPTAHPEAVEAWGLLGRAHKQIFLDAGNPTSAQARGALASAVDAYRRPYAAAPRTHTWHGVNLLALASRAHREGWSDIGAGIDTAALAAELLDSLRAVPRKDRDEWHPATMAEVALGLGLATGDLTAVEILLHEYLGADDVRAFQVASTLRQFAEVWGLERLTVGAPGVGLRGPDGIARARALVDILRARLLQLPGGGLTLAAAWVGRASEPKPSAVAGTGSAAVTQAFEATGPAAAQLEAILGAEGPQTYAWWRAGVEAARSVAVVRLRLGRRIGSGFLVSAGDVGFGTSAELLLLTNFHVVNPTGARPGIRPEDAEVVFEADDPQRACAVKEILWSSPVEQHDAALLRLAALPDGVGPLRIGAELPALPPAGEQKRPRVYVVGYPGGRELAFSFQDNELLDHEGPPSGRPQVPQVCRVHYRAPTEGGSSGSPVFEDGGWKVIALHHKGGRLGMPRLNGQPGSYAANEGLAMTALRDAIKASAS